MAASAEPPEPWRSDRPLDAKRVERVVDAQFEALAPSRATFFDSGWDSDVYVVNDAWILRFPKRREVEAYQAVERALLPRLRPRLSLPVPDLTLLGAPGPEFPYAFLGYRRLEGSRAMGVEADAIDLESIARTLGRFLSELHAVPIEEALKLGAPTGPPIAPAVNRTRERERWAEIEPHFSADLARRAKAELELAAGPWEGVPRRVVHSDLRSEHVLLDEGARRVTGILDWSDLRVDDPARDFAGLYEWLGASFARRVLSHYAGTEDPTLMERARRRAVTVGFATTWYGTRARRPEYVRSGIRGLEHALLP